MEEAFKSSPGAGQSSRTWVLDSRKTRLECQFSHILLHLPEPQFFHPKKKNYKIMKIKEGILYRVNHTQCWAHSKYFMKPATMQITSLSSFLDLISKPLLHLILIHFCPAYHSKLHNDKQHAFLKVDLWLWRQKYYTKFKQEYLFLRTFLKFRVRNMYFRLLKMEVTIHKILFKCILN